MAQNTTALKGRKWRYRKGQDQEEANLSQDHQYLENALCQRLQQLCLEDLPTAGHLASLLVWFWYDCGLQVSLEMFHVPGIFNGFRFHLQVLCTAGTNWRVFSFHHWLPGLPSFPVKSGWILYDLILQSISHAWKVCTVQSKSVSSSNRLRPLG